MLEILSSPVLIAKIILIIIVVAMTSIQIISLVKKSKPKDQTGKNGLMMIFIELEIIFKWLSKLAIFIAVSVGLTYALVMVLGPKYEASSTLFIEIKNNQNVPASNESLAASNKIANNIAELTKKGEIVDEVIKLSTAKNYSRKELIANLRANTIRDTQLVEISVQNTNAGEAQRLANVFAQVVKDKYKDLLSEVSGNSYIEIKIVQTAELPNETTFPSVKQAILLSTILATIIGIGTLMIIDLEKKNKIIV